MASITILKDWVSLAEGAKYLTDQLKEKVSSSDLIQLALSKSIKLSFYFEQPTHSCCAQVETFDDESLKIFLKDNGTNSNILEVEGVWGIEVYANSKFMLDDELKVEHGRTTVNRQYILMELFSRGRMATVNYWNHSMITSVLLAQRNISRQSATHRYCGDVSYSYPTAGNVNLGRNSAH